MLTKLITRSNERDFEDEVERFLKDDQIRHIFPPPVQDRPILEHDNTQCIVLLQSGTQRVGVSIRQTENLIQSNYANLRETIIGHAL
jgi:hypothetical protein